MGSSPDDFDTTADDIGEEATSDASSFITLLGHFYRGQLDRETTWRSRLDRTTDWSVIVIATILTWAFTSPENPHYVLLIGMVLIVVFLAVDTRRYRAYDVWRSRIRILEQDLFAQVFNPEPGVEHDQWRRMMSEDLRRPIVKVGLGEAVRRRLRRIYFPLITILLVGWLFHITIFQPHEPWYDSATIVGAPGPIVVAAVAVFYAAVVTAVTWPFRSTPREFYDEDPGAWQPYEEEIDEE